MCEKNRSEAATYHYVLSWKLKENLIENPYIVHLHTSKTNSRKSKMTNCKITQCAAICLTNSPAAFPMYCSCKSNVSVHFIIKKLSIFICQVILPVNSLIDLYWKNTEGLQRRDLIENMCSHHQVSEQIKMYSREVQHREQCCSIGMNINWLVWKGLSFSPEQPINDSLLINLIKYMWSIDYNADCSCDCDD